MCESLKQAEEQLVKYYAQHESSVGRLQSELSVLREEKTISEQAMHSEIEVLRGKFIEVTTELAKQKSRCSDLQVSLKQSKDTIAELVQKENNLIDELQGKMSQLGQSQDQWKNKVHEQKETIAQQRHQYEHLQTKFDQLTQSLQAGSHQRLEDELKEAKATIAKREVEIKEIVRTLKKFSDDKKLLEQENAELSRKNDTSEGH